jgi:hypothetical protein
MILTKCPHCEAAVLQAYDVHVSTQCIDFDWRPWTLDLEAMPDMLKTPAQKRRWVEERPYRLYLCILDFKHDTYTAAVDKPRGHVRQGVLFKPHSCEEKDVALYGKARTQEPG